MAWCGASPLGARLMKKAKLCLPLRSRTPEELDRSRLADAKTKAVAQTAHALTVIVARVECSFDDDIRYSTHL